MTTANDPILPVILCGGSGTRLWPLSRQSFPKQFVPLVGDKSLLQLTLERVAALQPTPTAVMCVTAEDHRFLVADTLKDVGMQGTVLLEPVARNTNVPNTGSWSAAPPKSPAAPRPSC